MDPITVSLITGLGIGLSRAVEKLAEKAFIDPALETGFAPFTKWIKRGYDEKQDADELKRIWIASLDEVQELYPTDDPQRLIATWKFDGLSQEQHTVIAAATLELARLDPEALPNTLIQSLGIAENQRDLLARFLFILRRNLAVSRNDYFSKAIAFANDLDQHNQLAGLTQRVISLQDNMARLESLFDTFIKDRRLAVNEAQALKNYLDWARARWGYLMLPLIRKRSGDVIQTDLKQVFVPLLLREPAMGKAGSPEKSKKSRTKNLPDTLEKETRLLSFGDLLNQHDRFILIGKPGCGKTTLLHRAALAFAEGRAETDLGWKGKNLLPIFTRLRNFGAYLLQHKDRFQAPCPGALIAYLESQLQDGERQILSPNFFDNRLKEGNCLILLDGLDEVSENRAEVAQHISEFIACYGKIHGNCFGLSSRPRGYETVERQLRPARLAEAEVQPMDAGSIRELIRNLLIIIEPNQIQREKDINDLAANMLSRVDLIEISSTPLFCSALVQVYKYHAKHLPERLVDVLDEIVVLLLGFWKAQQSLADSERFAAEDGTGKPRRLEEAVNIKRQRLSFLAHHMQEQRIVEIESSKAAEILADYLRERERVKDDEIGRLWAEEFLINSHERSGLLAEIEPGQYAFLHKSFMEYLAATWLVNRGQVIQAALAHLDDDWWEPVILLAGAHPGLPEHIRSDLINQILDLGEGEAAAGRKANCLVIAGRLATNMKDDLPGSEQERVEQALLDGLHSGRLNGKQRAQVGAELGRLGDPRAEVMTIEEMPFCYIQAGSFLMGERNDILAGGLLLVKGKNIREENLPAFWLGKYPVSNTQFDRFIQARGYENGGYWPEARAAGFWKDGKFKGRYDDEARNRPVQYGEPFGLPNHPVVGVSWYEAAAFARWLDGLAQQQGWIGAEWQVHLPNETQWEKAARGGQRIPEPANPENVFSLKAITHANPAPAALANPLPERAYPWGDDLSINFANVNETRIGATSAAGCFTRYAGPYGNEDLAGNVWEWQRNWYDQAQDLKDTRGGAWYDDPMRTRCTAHYFGRSSSVLKFVGFRVSLSPRSRSPVFLFFYFPLPGAKFLNFRE